MPQYSLLEYKLRRYIYLGHCNNIYVPRSFRNSFWANEKFHDDFTGVKLIGKIVQKKDTCIINSIVPILLKIKNENKLFEDEHLLFALAVCSRFNDKHCQDMVANAYNAVQVICKDGLQILKFAYMVKVSAHLLYQLGYVKNNATGFGEGFRKVLRRWYLNNDPYEVTRQIVTHRNYKGINHKTLMSICHLDSPDPCRKIFIINTFRGFEKIRSDFNSNFQFNNVTQLNSRLQLLYIYHYLEKINYVYSKMPLENMFSLTWEKDFLTIPQRCLNDYHALTFFVTHSPLKALLENTYSLAKKRYFYNVLQYEGCWKFIARFNETELLQKSGIHPFESYLEYVRYRYSGLYESEIKAKKMNLLKKSYENTLFNVEIWNPSLDSTEVLAIKNNSIDGSNQTQQSNILSESSTVFDIGFWNPSLDCTEVPAIKNNSIDGNNQTQQSNILSESSSVFDIGLWNPSLDSTKLVSEIKNKSNDFYNQTQSLTKASFEIGHWNPSLSFTKVPLIKKKLIDINNQTPKPAVFDIGFWNSSLDSTKVPVVINKQNKLKNNTKSKMNELNTSALQKSDKPKPKKAPPLLNFLSVDLMEKTLKNLKPLDYNILIAYDSRHCTYKQFCKYMHLKFLRVFDAIVLVILSIIYPKSSHKNKPIICALKDSGKPFSVVKIDYTTTLTFETLEKMLTENLIEDSMLHKKNTRKNIDPLNTVNWVIKSSKNVDVFVFLGMHDMNINNLIKSKRYYEKCSGKKVKIIVCSLTGGHSGQMCARDRGVLFIIGFDKNVGKIIYSFINEEF